MSELQPKFGRSLSAILISAHVGATVKPISMHHGDRTMHRCQIFSRKEEKKVFLSIFISLLPAQTAGTEPLFRSAVLWK